MAKVSAARRESKAEAGEQTTRRHAVEFVLHFGATSITRDGDGYCCQIFAMGEIMLRAILLTTLMIVSVPSFATEAGQGTMVAQENKPAQQAPKRDCEKRDEGVS
jgi:hypothetical protein